MDAANGYRVSRQLLMHLTRHAASVADPGRWANKKAVTQHFTAITAIAAMAINTLIFFMIIECLELGWEG